MTTVTRPLPPGSAERLVSALPLDTGDALLALYGTGTSDRYCCGDHQERGFEEALWSLLRSAGYQRVVFCTLDGLYFRDTESDELDRGGAPALATGATGAMSRFSGPQGTKVVAPAEPAAATGSARTMLDPQIVQKLNACMTGRTVRTAVVLLRTEDFLHHNQAQRPLVDRIGAWIAAGPSAGNLCVLAFSNGDLEQVQESVRDYHGLAAFLSDQRRREGEGIGLVGPPEQAEVARLVQRVRILDGLRIADWTRLDQLVSAMAATNLPAKPWFARLRGLARDGVPLSAEALRERRWIETATSDNRPALTRLRELTGLREVKEHVTRLAARARVRQRRPQTGEPPSPHLIFTGNPGTGKTTVARLIGEIYHDLGLLKRGHVVVADAPKLVAGYIGQTAIQTSAAIDEALGGVLFIDEAYRLVEADRGGFGMEAIDTLVDRMENDRASFVVIAAGYPGRMDAFRNANPGLPGRFPDRNVITFADYEPDDLLRILIAMLRANGLSWPDTFNADLARVTEGLYRDRDGTFGNAREMRELAAEIEDSWAMRVTDDYDIPLQRSDLPARVQGYLS